MIKCGVAAVRRVSAAHGGIAGGRQPLDMLVAGDLRSTVYSCSYSLGSLDRCKYLQWSCVVAVDSDT